MKSLSLFFSILLVSSASLAQMPAAKGMTPTASPTPRHMGPAAYTPTLVGTPKPTKTEGFENNGQSASSKQGQGGAAAAASLAKMAQEMAANCPACAIRGTCPVCVAAGIGLGASALTGNEMDRAQGLSNTQVSQVNPTATPGVREFAASPNYTAAMKDLQKATNGTGVSISKDFRTLTMPDGRTIDVGKAATTGAGLTSGEISLLKDQMKKAQEAAAKATVASANTTQDSSGTGDEQVSGAAAPSVNTEIASGNVLSASRGSRVPANVAGTYKDLNGDRIGVSVDSMFEMMHRRYRASSDRDYFMKSER